MKFGEKLRQLRLEKGFTQEEVASAVNVSRRTYIGYEQEGRYPRKRELYSRLAQVLDTETSYLLTEDEEFVSQASDKYGNRGKLQAEKLVAELSGMFAGGELSDSDKDAVMIALQKHTSIVKKIIKNTRLKNTAKISENNILRYMLGGVSLLDSYQIFKQANNLVRQCGTRDALKIAENIGIKIYYEPAFTNLLGMYTFRWNHRMMFLNPRMESYLLQMVAAHEIGHDIRHRNLAKTDGLREFVLFNMKDTTEYEANAFGSHLLLDNDKVYELAKQGYDVVQISAALGSDINLMLIKLQEMNKLGYDFNIPFTPDSKFFRKIER